MFIRVCAGLLIGSAVVSTPLLEAQGPVQRPGYHASWWTTADGLPGNFVMDIAQGSDGRLWLVAGGMLARFDGRGFEVVPVGDPLQNPQAEFPVAVERGAGGAWEGSKVGSSPAPGRPGLAAGPCGGPVRRP